jgi:hemin uptake protein HemP
MPDDKRPSQSPPPQSVRQIDAESLLQGQPELRLVYRGTEYRLRVTRQGKLLLTK